MAAVAPADNVPGYTLMLNDGRCWKHKGDYLGKLMEKEIYGRLYNQSVKLKFESGKIFMAGQYANFTEVPCVVKGGRRTKRRARRKSHSRRR